MTLDEARAAFRQWLHLPDTGALDVVLGTIAANRLEGDPVWLLLVGPPGGGKSELLNSISGLHDSHPTGTLTEAALLSGTPAKEKAAGARGGLLRSIGDHGIIVCKDFGSVLSMHTDARARVLAALREVYDGEWTRHVGTDGGKTLHWEGRVGLVGGCTPSIDRHHAVMGAMGERFTLYRLPKIDGKIQARASIQHAGHERTMRQELSEAAHAVLADRREPTPNSEAEIERLIELSSFVVLARSAVERDGFTREIELVSEPEAPGRLIVVLDRLLSGLDSIGCQRQEAFGIITKAALDSIPALRLAVLETLADEHADWMDTNQVAQAVRHPAVTTRRALEDLVAHHLVDQRRQEGPGSNPPHLWNITDDTKNTLRLLKQSVSEKPVAVTNPLSEMKYHVSEKPYTPSISTQAQERDKGTRLFGNADSDTNGHDPALDLAYYTSLEPEADE